MPENDDVKMRNVDTDQAAPATTQEKVRAARRKFLRQALAVTSGVALAELLPSALLGSPQQVQCTQGQALIPIGEIRSNGTKLQAVLKVVNANRDIPTSVVAKQSQMLRFYKGYNTNNPSQSWPPDNRTAPGPGPTFRCSIGDEVQITFINQVDVGKYPSSAFSGQKGSETGCDNGTTNTDPNWYPKTAGDDFPNCFHASSAANVHFHGTHVTPSTTGDNVLVNIWPDPTVNDRATQAMFKPIFDSGQIPQKWGDLPVTWRDDQLGPQSGWPNSPNKGRVGKYDDTAPYKGGRGLPPNLRLWPVDYNAITANQWPQYFVGSYPIFFKIPVYTGAPGGVKMGQAPGTHWYHSHKHGSTSINMFNGLSGALIIEDNSPNGYDGKLKAFYQNRLEQVVMVFQQITGVTNLLTAGAGAAPILINGQFTPTITMRPGQVQLWRMVNACVQKAFKVQFAPCTTGGPTPQFKQTAQDGVQLDFANYNKSTNGQNPINVAPANRVDALVQAPRTAGVYVLGTTAAPLAFIRVTTVTPTPMGFPNTVNDYPTMPPYLNNIRDDEIKKPRTIVYGWDKNRVGPGRDNNNAAPKYTIDGKQFQDGVVNQTMTLNTAEEWTITNQTSVAHPFHIHVNPFQIIEVFDPNTMSKPVRIVDDIAAAQQKYGTTKDYILGPPVWWDNFAIPIAQTVASGPNKGNVILGPNGFAATPGYFVMRSRFVDFTGLYVQHCHILAHEDRGMMQLLQVCRDPNSQECKDQTANVKHH
jgi:FtsP/CotA-like multicopper oxidase with cupredoxin domain